MLTTNNYSFNISILCYVKEKNQINLIKFIFD